MGLEPREELRLKITIVGSGHGGCAMAGTLAMRGHEVTILKLTTGIHFDNWQALLERKAICLDGIEGTGKFALHGATTDPAAAIPDAELILVFYVSNYHDLVAKSCAPHLHRGQIVVLNPGYAGSLLFEQAMTSIQNTSYPLFAEFETLPYSSRITQPGCVEIVSKNIRHPFATYPASRRSEFLERLESILGELVPRNHLLEVALHNPNLVIHVVGVLMNVSLIERPGNRFAMYRQGFSPSLWNLVAALDQEKMDVLEQLGAPRIPYLDEFRLRTFEDPSIEGLEGFSRYAEEAPEGPFAIEHRYVTEDVPMGLGLLSSLGRATGVASPICDGLISIANALLPSHDFWQEARTLDKLWGGTLKELLHKLTR